MPNYYDPNTFARVDPTRVRTVAGGTQWDSGDMLPDQYWTGDQTADDQGYMRANSGTRVNQGNNIDAWGAAQGFNGGGGFGTATSKYLNDLNAQYGLDVNDFSQALTDYNTRNATPGGSAQWWEDQAQGRAFADSLGRIDPRYSAGWTNDAGLEATQQNRIGGVLQNVQANSSNFGDELKTLGMLAGVAAGGVGLAGLAGVGGAAAGAGAGAAGAAGELGAAGGLWGGELGLAGVQSAVPTFAEIGAGAAASGGGAIPGGLDSYIPDVSSLTDAYAPQTGGLNPGLDPSVYPSGPSGLDVPGGLDAVSPGMGTPSVPTTPPTGGLGGGGGGGTGSDFPVPNSAAVDDAITANVGNTEANWAQRLLSQGTGAIASAASALGMTPTALTSLLGKLIGGGLDAYASSQRNDALQANADRAFNMGAPYRDRLAAYYANPSAAIANDPAIQASVNQGTNAMARALSARDGNPTGSGRALQELQNYSTQQLYGQYGNELNRLANFGGLSAFNAAAPGMGVQAAGDSGVIGSIATTARQILDPQQSYGNLLRSMGINTPLP